MIGEQFEEHDEICGAVINIRNKQDRISVWTKTSTNESAQMTIGRKLKAVLELPENQKIGFTSHDDSLKMEKKAKVRRRSLPFLTTRKLTLMLHTDGLLLVAQQVCIRWALLHTPAKHAQHTPLGTLHARPAGVPQPSAYRQRGRQYAPVVLLCVANDSGVCMLQTVLHW